MARSPHIPSNETKAQVEALVVAGVNQPQIAGIIGVDPKTLRKYYSTELEQGLDRAIGNVANTLLNKALNGDTASIIFFLKARAKKYGWTERTEVTGADGGPIEQITQTREAADAFTGRIAGIAAREDEGG